MESENNSSKEIEGNPVLGTWKSRVLKWFVWKKKHKDFLVAQEQELGASGHWALLDL